MTGWMGAFPKNTVMPLLNNAQRLSDIFCSGVNRGVMYQPGDINEASRGVSGLVARFMISVPVFLGLLTIFEFARCRGAVRFPDIFFRLFDIFTYKSSVRILFSLILPTFRAVCTMRC